MKNAFASLLLPALVSGILSCATLAEKNPQRLIIGAWEITGVNCDSAGEGCHKDEYCGMVLKFTDKGELLSGGKKSATYRVDGNTLFIANSGGNNSVVNIIRIDDRTMLTREEGKDTSERLDRVAEKD